MFKILCAIAALAVLAASCATARAPRIAYACEARLTNEHGAFVVGPSGWRWTYGLGDGASASIGQSEAWQSYESILADGFVQTERLDTPGIVITFDRRFDRNDWREQPPALSVAGEIRVGAQAKRDWVSNTRAIVFNYSEWHGLLSEPGDMEVLLFESPSRTHLQRGILPRAALLSVEPTLQSLIRQLREMQTNPVANCEAYEEEEIILT
jgi:hypothetical protein